MRNALKRGGKITNCSKIQDLETEEILGAMPKNLRTVVGTKWSLAEYFSKFSNVPTELSETRIHDSQISKAIVKCWHIDYSISSNEEYLSMMSELEEYIDLKEFFYSLVITKRDFLIFMGENEISIMYMDGRWTLLQDENEKLLEESYELNRIPKFIRKLFKYFNKGV